MSNGKERNEKVRDEDMPAGYAEPELAVVDVERPVASSGWHVGLTVPPSLVDATWSRP